MAHAGQEPTLELGCAFYLAVAQFQLLIGDLKAALSFIGDPGGLDHRDGLWHKRRKRDRCAYRGNCSHDLDAARQPIHRFPQHDHFHQWVNPQATINAPKARYTHWNGISLRIRRSRKTRVQEMAMYESHISTSEVRWSQTSGRFHK